MTETKEQEMLRYLYSHQYVVPVIYRAIEWQSRHGTPFRWYDVRAMQKDLDRMVLDGVLTKKGSKGYLLTDIKTATDAYLTYVAAVRALRQERAKTDGEHVALPPGIERGLFDDIVGYDDVKKQMFLALGAKDPVHVLMVGPPSTAKSLFLDSLRKLPGAKLAFGDAISKAGLRRFIQEEKPQYLVIDEIDKMDPSDASILLELMEHQTVSVMHYDEESMETVELKVFGAANDVRQMKKELLSRFHKIELREYTSEEFRAVAYRHLTKMGTDAEMARIIADGVSMRSRDIRDAIRVARMSRTAEDARFLIDRLGTTAQV